MKLLIALALAAAPSALAMAPYVPPCAAGAHTWRMINEPTPDAEAIFRRQPPDCSLPLPPS